MFRLDPETIELDDDGHGQALLRWEVPSVSEVEIRVDSPLGPLFAQGGSSGSARTGHWVRHTTRFYLIDSGTGRILAETGATRQAASGPSLDGKQQPTVSAGTPPDPSGQAAGETIPLEERMRRDWDERARENALFYVATGQRDWSEEDFFQSGRQTVKELILNDMINICRGRDPKQMRVLEIGCGVGRITRALAEVFGEVVAVDVSSVMVEKARGYLSSCENVSLFVNNGRDLEVLGNGCFDFAFSHITFQHIPSKDVIRSYIAETGRLLRPGGLFKFGVQGYAPLQHSRDDTWLGTPLTKQELTEIADGSDFEHRHALGEGQQVFYQWFFKKGPATLQADPNPARPCGSGNFRTVLSWDAPAVEHVEVRIGPRDRRLADNGASRGSQRIELQGTQAVTCDLLDLSDNRILSSVVVQCGRGLSS